MYGLKQISFILWYQLACCCGSAACSLCCSACPSCSNSTSSRLMYAVMLLVMMVAACVMLAPGLHDALQKVSLIFKRIIFLQLHIKDNFFAVAGCKTRVGWQKKLFPVRSYYHNIKNIFQSQLDVKNEEKQSCISRSKTQLAMR